MKNTSPILNDINEYLVFVSQVKNLSENTTKSYERDLKKLYLFLEKLNVTNYSDIKEEVCSAWIGDLYSQNNKPTYGFIQERIDKGEDFVDCKGKKPICYANIMEKLQISIKQARSAATEAGLEIPESQFILEKKTRGRPRKNIAVPDTPSECDSEEPVKRGRGRPKKDKKIINQDNCDEIIEKLKNTVQINDIKENKIIEQSSSDVEDVEDESEEETSVECVKIVGKKLMIIEQNDDGSIPKDTQYLCNSSRTHLQ